jgi:hypothetical protein
LTFHTKKNTVTSFDALTAAKVAATGRAIGVITIAQLKKALEADGFDEGLTPRMVALEIQQQLLDKHDIESELMLDSSQRPTVSCYIDRTPYHRSRCIATVGQISDVWGPVRCVYFKCGSDVIAAECLSFKQLMDAVEACFEPPKIPQPLVDVR